MPKRRSSSVVVAISLCLPGAATSRSWRDIRTYHSPETRPLDDYLLVEAEPLEFSMMPTSEPSSNPTHKPTESPTISPNPTEHPTSEPTTAAPSSRPTEEDPYPENETPLFPPVSYFNYDTREGSRYGPGTPGLVYQDGQFTVAYQNNAWDNVILPRDSYWSEFDKNGFGAWKGVLAKRNPLVNQCGNVGEQSPIDVRLSGVACVEHHQIRTRAGDHGVKGAGVDKRIESNKLRLVYQRRPCSNILDAVCAEPDPPAADFPNGWGGFADLMHVDFKVPAEHRINGEQFDGEMQIYHLHPDRKRLPAVSSLMRVEDNGYNAYLQVALDAFQYQYDLDRAKCADNMRRGRKLATDFQSQLNSVLNNSTSEVLGYHEIWGDYSTLLDNEEFIQEGEQHRRRMQGGVWNPHSDWLIPTYWFYGYDGSLTEPPCTEIVSWFIMDTPMIIGRTQLDQIKNLIFTHVDENCERTSVHYDESVARPIQDTAGRQVWQCTRADFVPDAEKNKN